MVSDQSIVQTLSTVRSKNRLKVLKIMQAIAAVDGATLKEISISVEENVNNIHPILQRLIKRGSLSRRGTPIRYYLSPEINRCELQEWIDKFSQNEALDRPRLPQSAQPLYHSQDIILVLLAKLPDFNPQWAPEVQVAWFNALISLKN